MISTKKQFHLLGENQRQPSPSLTNPTLNITIKENRQQGLTAETQDFLRWGYKHSED
jgi:hypothetical protein